ncbi:MAG: cell division protein FtsA [Chloroflexota bacterium]
MEWPIIVGIDVGTTKVCTLVARLEADKRLRILGVGIEPSHGMRKGVVVDLEKLSGAIARSIDKAERTAGMEITSGWVSVAGSHVSSLNNRGVVGIGGRVIQQHDINRALEAAAAVTLPHNREIVHIIQRGFTVDGQNGVRVPLGMHAYRLEVEAHIITAAAASLKNLRQCVSASGVDVTQFVLNPLASGEVVLTETEREMGVIVCDIGGGTTDFAIYIEGDVWHTKVLSVGGDHITSDIAQGLRLPLAQAEEMKVKHGYAMRSEVGSEEHVTVRPFGETKSIQISRQELSFIIEARVEEIFDLVLKEIKRTGYDGLLPAGIVLTGGTSSLAGISALASEVMGLPARVACPEKLYGMTDRLYSPAYSTSVGLLNWALLMSEVTAPAVPSKRKGGIDWKGLLNFLERLLP